MKNVRQVVEAVRDAGKCKRFDAQGLGMTDQRFQLVVGLIREADARGFFETVKEHESALTGLVDLVLVEGVTEDGEDFLSAA